jgi:hypothetical protein
MEKELLRSLVSLGESSRLKNDLNAGIALLFGARESYFQPHLSLNGEKGLAILTKIAGDPQRANTEFMIESLFDMSWSNAWLNVQFTVFLDRMSSFDCMVQLSPRQTACLVQNLPWQSKREVLAKIKKWYFEAFLSDIQKGLNAISRQFTNGDQLVDDYFDGRIFDIHSKRPVPYSECLVVGEKLYWDFLCAIAKTDELGTADIVIEAARGHQKDLAERLLVMAKKTP